MNSFSLPSMTSGHTLSSGVTVLSAKQQQQQLQAVTPTSEQQQQLNENGSRFTLVSEDEGEKKKASMPCWRQFLFCLLANQVQYF